MARKLANLAVNTEADALAALLNSGKIKVYSGTPPATADDALSGNTLLAEMTFGATAFGAASNGVLTANAITSDASANASGVATFYRATQSDDDVVWQGDVGTTGTDLVLNTTNIVAGGLVSCSSLTHTIPKG